MKSYTTLRNLYGQLTNDSSSANLTLGDQLINDSYRKICAERNWDFLEGTNTTTTVASQQAYGLPYDYSKLIDVYITVGSYRYVPREVSSRDEWDRLNEMSAYTSNFPVWFFIYGGQLNFWPTPSSSGNTITYNYSKAIVDLSIADNTTGTVSITTATTAVTGSGTSWNASMIGKYLKVTPSTTAATNGDGFWYKISAVASTTALTLEKAYGGATVAGAALTIGQMPVITEAFQDMPVYEAAQIYFSTVMPEPAQATFCKEMFNRKYEGLIADSKKSAQVHLYAGPVEYPINPNLMVSL
jgi:hypothetical protein